MNESPMPGSKLVRSRICVDTGETDDAGKTIYSEYDSATHGTEPMKALEAAYIEFMNDIGQWLDYSGIQCYLERHMWKAIDAMGSIPDIKINPFDPDMAPSKWDGGYWVIDPGGYSAQFPVHTSTLAPGVVKYWIGFEHVSDSTAGAAETRRHLPPARREVEG